MEDSAAGSILAGALIAVGGVWSSWLSAWLVRVELRVAAEREVEESSGSFAPEGSARAIDQQLPDGQRRRWRLRGGAPSVELLDPPGGASKVDTLPGAS